MKKNTPFRTILVFFLAFHVCLFMPFVALAQDAVKPGRVEPIESTAKRVNESSPYYLGTNNELLMRVNIWGRVRSPGQYYIPATTDLITLVSVAGGPIDRSSISDVRVVRSGIQGQNEVIIVNLKKYLKTGDKRLIPQLQPEDTIVVSGSVWQFIGDIALIIGQLSLAANFYYLITTKR
jgi:hypothetical protein